MILASGGGSNADKILQYFQNSDHISAVSVISNRENVGVLEVAKNYGVKAEYFPKVSFSNGEVLKYLKEIAPDLIVLAGFLLQISPDIVQAFPNQIVNIHPALLPKYGGHGMYGKFVHQAVFENQEAESGISIHFVNENYDEGALIFQASTSVKSCQTPEEIASKVLELEHEHYPKVIENLLS